MLTTTKIPENVAPFSPVLDPTPLVQRNGDSLNGKHGNGNGPIYDNIDWDSIITEDETPVENYASEQNYPLLTTTPYDSWEHSIYGKNFMVAADVGVFYSPDIPALVPDVFLSLGVKRPDDLNHKRRRSYFIWEVHKPPEIAIEIVSNKKGHEDGSKLTKYVPTNILYYVVFDPLKMLKSKKVNGKRLPGKMLQAYKLVGQEYVKIEETWFPEIELGLTIWRGEYQGNVRNWLRWCDVNGNLIPTGSERAKQVALQAEQAVLQAEQERQARIEAEAEIAQLRALLAARK